MTEGTITLNGLQGRSEQMADRVLKKQHWDYVTFSAESLSAQLVVLHGLACSNGITSA